MSESAKLRKGDYSVTNSIGRSVSTVFPIMTGGQQSPRLILGRDMNLSVFQRSGRRRNNAIRNESSNYLCTCRSTDACLKL